MHKSEVEASVPYYWKSFDPDEVVRDYPPSPELSRTVEQMSRDEVRAMQEVRFRKVVESAWKIPFYRRHWGAAGIEPGDIKGLDDLSKLPVYSVNEIRDSIERCPPFGDFMGISPADSATSPLAMVTSGGTTGLPRPMFYAPREREIMAILRARSFYMHGIRPGDMAQVTLALGTSNAGLGSREALWKYLGAIPLMTGSGNTTPSLRQIELARQWRTTAMIGYPAYFRRLAMVAREEFGIDPKELGIRTLSSHLGYDDRASVEDLWGAPCFDAYGSHEAGTIASECQAKDGMHIFEDAFYVEILDPETHQPVPEGETGNIVVTALYRNDVPIVRYNINDISSLLPAGCSCGACCQRLGPLAGRSDNMIKLRGTNIYPDGIGRIVGEDRRTNGEFVCLVERVGAIGQDEMTVKVEVPDPVSAGAVVADLARQLRAELGVRISVEASAPGELSPLTGLDKTSKVRRLIDNRMKAGA